MQDMLGEYVRSGSPEAFQSLVRGHIDSVYSQSLRQLRDPATAEDVTQQVFISLAKKAAKLSPGVVLEGWLFTATRYCCANQHRAAGRRRSAERKAATMRKEAVESSTGESGFASEAEPILDDAIANLGERDRNAVLLRYFQGQTLREVGNALGVSEDAAKQRVSRAVEKLRNYFARRGILASSEVIASALGCAVKPTAPHAVQAVLSMTLSPSTHAVGMLSKVTLSGSKIAAGILAAGTIAAASIAGHIALAQTPVPSAQSAPSGQSIPATRPSSQATPIDTLSTLCAAIESNDAKTIDDCVCGDGANPDQTDLGRAEFEEEAANYRLSKAWQDKFGQRMAVSGYGFDLFADHHTAQSALRATLEVPGGPQVTIDGDIAQVKIPLPPEYFTGKGPNRMAFLGRWSGAMLVFNRVGQDWKLNTDRTLNFIIEASRINGNDTDVYELGAKIGQGVADSLNDVADKIEDGSIHTRGQAVRAVQTDIGRVFQTNKVNGEGATVLPVIGG